MRLPPVLALVTVLVACSSNGDEQRSFIMQAGSGTGASADQMVATALAKAENASFLEGSGEHIAWVDTVLGRIDIFAFSPAGTSEPWRCEGRLSDDGAGWHCFLESDPAPTDAVTLLGSGGNATWAEANFRVKPDVAEIVASVGDGTQYRLTPAAGVAVMVWPRSKGSILAIGYDGHGNPLGQMLVEPIQD